MAEDDRHQPVRSATTPTTAPELIVATTSTFIEPARPPTLRLRQSSSGTRARLARHISTQERLNGILELGRQRAESMAPGQTTPLNFRSPRAQLSPLLLSTSPGTNSIENDDGLEEPNETTGIITKGPAGGRAASAAMNYQSTAMMTTTTTTTMESNGARHRRGDSTPRSNTGRRRENGSGCLGGDGLDEANDGGGGGGDKEAGAWWKAQLAKFGSIELENKGSVARDHLALERTFLAWLRTSLSFASIGIAITQLFRLNTSLASEDSANAHRLQQLGKPLGAVFLGISILMLFLGYHRYFQAQQWIIKGKFPASRGTVILVSLVALGLMVTSLIVVLLVQPATSSA